LLAGFTSLQVLLYLLHFWSKGPAGIFASSIPI
jgi:hypothetical protein